MGKKNSRAGYRPPPRKKANLREIDESRGRELALAQRVITNQNWLVAFVICDVIAHTITWIIK